MTELPPGAGPVERIAPGTLVREWQVVRFLGRGSYGVVFEARRSSWLDEPPRALKVFDPIVSAAARSALLGEFSALVDIRHPHLLAGIDAFDLVEPPYAGCVVFVLELADEDLSHRVARCGPLPAAEVAAVGAEVADGLAALHGQGRIHGDVKPENILRVGDRWTLGDFGVTGLLEGSYAVTAGATIDYRPPELADAREGTRLHRSADVWALGATLHVAATGQHPFHGPDPLMRFAAAVRGDRRPAAGVPPALAAVVDGCCLLPDPHARLDATELAARLRTIAHAPPAAGSAPTTAGAGSAGTGPDAAASRAGAGVSGSGPGGAPPAADPDPLRAPTVADPPPAPPSPPSPTVPYPTPPAPVPEPPRLVGAPPVVAPAPATPPPGTQAGPPPGPASPAAPPPAPTRPQPVPPAATPPAGARSGPAAVATAAMGGPQGRRVVALTALITLAVTQVVAVAAGGLLDELADRRLAYVIVSLALTAVTVVLLAGRLPSPARWRAAGAAVAAAGLVWAMATALLFGAVG